MRSLVGVLGLILPTLTLGCGSDDGETEPGGAGGSGGAAGGAGGAAGSSDAGASSGGAEGGVDQMLSELDDAGWFKYVGQFTPADEETAAGGVMKHWFDIEPKGPECIDSSRYGMTTRDQGSENLAIFLMGGGACWRGSPLCTETVGTQIDMLVGDGIPMVSTGSALASATWNHAAFPYCDGSTFSGDNEIDLFGTDGDFGVPWADGDEILHGLQNLTAGLDVVKARFPSARRILLSGTSAGGFGTLWATGLVRMHYPDAEIFVFNDAGVGVLKDDDPAYLPDLMQQYGAEGRFPASCTECMNSPHLTPVVSWGLSLDPNLTTAAFSATEDGIIAGTFLGYGADKSVWTNALIREGDAIVAAHPDRFKRFMIPGEQHTALTDWATTSKDGVAIEQWVGAMLDGDDTVWKDMP